MLVFGHNEGPGKTVPIRWLVFGLFLVQSDLGQPRSDWRTRPAYGWPEPYEDDSHHTTGVQDAHKTCAREVIYRWHPWFGRTVWVQGELRRGGSAVLRCVRDELHWSASLEIPKWMFDAGFCTGMKPDSLAHVSSDALLTLQEFLATVTDCIESGTVQAQHLSSNLGGADANNIPIQNCLPHQCPRRNFHKMPISGFCTYWRG